MSKSSAKKKASNATSNRKKPAIEDEKKRCDTCNRVKKTPRFRLLADKDPKVYSDTCLICEAKQGVITDDPKEFANTKIRRDFDTERRAKIQQELAYRELCRRNLLTYVQRYEPTYQAGWVHKKVAAKLEEFLEKCVRGEAPRLMLFMPPRHGKTMLASDYFVSWSLGRYPWLEMISTSHSAGLPIKASRRIRSRLQHKSHQAIFENTKIAQDSRNVEHWNTTQGGGFLAAGVGGGITGHGAHIFIIDDPVKDAEEADSETVRDNHWDWWSSTASTRIAPGGGVLVIQCMTGDTPVSMADGGEKRLDAVRPGDMVLSWKNGEVVSRQVLNWANQGEDDVFVMRTSSGRMVRANARHPFLVCEHGELKWVRVRNLRSAQQIVIKKDSGGNGGAKSVARKGATDRCRAVDCASHITTNGNGLRDIVRRLLSPEDNVNRISNIDTGSMLLSITASLKNKAADALCAVYRSTRSTLLDIGIRLYALTMTPLQRKYAGSYATTATSYSNEVTQSRSSNLPYDTDDFTTDTIVSINYAGEEEVFDIEVEDTHNFLANVIVASNTRWHDDDLGGRMLSQEREAIAEGVPEAELEGWEVISFPALAEENEYELPDGAFTGEDGEGRPGAKLIRHKDEALHPERWPESFLRRKRRMMQPRHWSALYQQNPVPDEGITFTKDMFVTQQPRISGHTRMTLLCAWDLAIGQKQHHDWTVGIVGGLDRFSNLHILDMVRGRWGTMQICDAILDIYQKYPEIQRIGIERGQLELAIREPLESRMQERRLYPVLDRSLSPIQDKEKRAGPLQGMMQHHRVLFPPERDHPWVTRIREEALRFPAGVHEDTVDALAWLARMAYNTTPPQEPSKPRFVSWKEQLKHYVEDGHNKDPMAV